MSCSEDGSVRMWEIQDLPLPAEPASPGDTYTPGHTHTQSCDFSADTMIHTSYSILCRNLQSYEEVGQPPISPCRFAILKKVCNDGSHMKYESESSKTEGNCLHSAFVCKVGCLGVWGCGGAIMQSRCGIAYIKGKRG